MSLKRSVQSCVKAGTRSVRLVLCGLHPTDQLRLWPIIVEPQKGSNEQAEGATNSTARQTQMQDIQQILQHSTQDPGLQSGADPKRRFMHALATAALRQVRPTAVYPAQLLVHT